MTDRFEQLLLQLGPLFGLKLHPDKIGGCSIAITPSIKVQLQLDLVQENLFLFSKIIEIPPGKFRENVLRDALKANAFPDPLSGILCYLPTPNELCLYQSYPVLILNGERLAGLVGAFVEMAESWHHAIKNGQSSPNLSRPPSSPPFGFKP